ncbi:hypothetical protein HHI36_020140 [Cryptolaemus montrouzieri]|uniref:Uncharacterized protein n=1 Tax=Cryptolaemus montrouzieri TaxID=559131 RepID=A0ABD2N9L0_9CUCU
MGALIVTSSDSFQKVKCWDTIFKNHNCKRSRSFIANFPKNKPLCFILVQANYRMSICGGEENRFNEGIMKDVKNTKANGMIEVCFLIRESISFSYFGML